MSSDYSYDDEAQFFPYFILTLTGLVTLPLTYSLVRTSTDDDAIAPRIQTAYRIKDAAVVDSLRSAQKRKQRRLKRTVAAVAGWALMALMVYLVIVTEPATVQIWNPYHILGISEQSASEKQIKSHYKRLSVKFHPDKVRPDPAKNQTVESLNDHYVELTKAYQALTDEDVRNNYIQYGHPDGKQSFSIGIALPKFIVSDGNGRYLVLLYTGLVGVLLPYLVGSWWYGTKRRSKEGVWMESANNLFREYDDATDEAGIVAALSAGKEFEEVLRGDQAESGLSKVEARILAEGQCSPLAGGLSVKDRFKLEYLSGVRRKALALLWAYLGRVELDDAALTRAKYEIAPIARALNKSFAAIALAYGNTKPIAGSFYVNQHLIQAMPPRSSPLLQLPHFTPRIVVGIEAGLKAHMTVQHFMDLPDAERRSLVVGRGRLSEAEYKASLAVGRQLPYLRVAKAFFKVTGERVIIPSSLVSLVIKGRFIPPGTENVPPVNELDLEDVDPAEDDLEALMGRKTKTVKGDDGRPVSVEEKTVLPPLTFAPYYAREHRPKWYAFLSDSKQGKMAVPPFIFDRFDQPIFDEDGRPTFAMQTLKAQFAAPPQAGHYTFVMHVICDSYVGFDTKVEVTLVVEEEAKAAGLEAEDDISEPDEDSIAGQMQALKTGQPPAPRRRRADESDDDSDESGTDEEADDTSDTNTDTEDEA
ncbi:hypothetical protein L249_6627 [Ophiocordyceps polyrhachis-furcata BCC 54312]|uniref:J domain-containing protein n=1 Tax=Ophiocordyceps polyrhachis-furcata BCC 54312 TaxID=1330021 RepID=A0A367LJL2_9HYPO|nr:hypothetical protein L249_6627 [Ophiocordyceps polyrhachis-furcata BCC 54312]